MSEKNSQNSLKIGVFVVFLENVSFIREQIKDKQVFIFPTFTMERGEYELMGQGTWFTFQNFSQIVFET